MAGKPHTEPKVFSAAHLVQRQYHKVGLSEPYRTQVGDPDVGFALLCYGPSASGKSTWIYKFANHLALNHGKTLVNSWEEGLKSTLADRLKRIPGELAKGLSFGDRLSFEEFCAKLSKGRYTTGMIDSIQSMHFTYAMLKEFQASKAMRSKNLLLVSQVNNNGQTKGGTSILHEVDIKVEIVRGFMTVRSRYLDQDYYEQLFTPKTAAKQEPQTALFS